MISRTLIQILPDPSTGTVTLSAFVQIKGRWFTEPRCVEAGDFKRPPSAEELEADVNDAVELGLFGSSGWWRPVAAPALGQPNFLTPSTH